MARTYATPAAVLTVAVLFPVLGTVFVALRFVASKGSKAGLSIDDWLVVPALILQWAMGGLLIWGASTKSLGDLLPMPDVPGPNGYLFSDSDQQVRLLQIQYHVDWIGVFAFGLMKLSILFFYHKIFCPASAKRSVFAKVVKTMIGLVTVWMITFGIGAIFLCGTSPTYAWAPVAVIAQKCSAQLPFLEGYAISDFIMDCLIWALPIPKIWSLHMPTRKKMAVAAVFLVGILTIAASAARMAIYIIYIVNAFAQSDGETLITYLLFWTMVEVGLGLLVVCLPTLRSLLGKASPGNIISDIKSAFSIRSLRSSPDSQSRSLRHESMDKTADPLTAGSNKSSNTSYAAVAADLEGQTPPKLGIRVTREVEQY